MENYIESTFKRNADAIDRCSKKPKIINEDDDKIQLSPEQQKCVDDIVNNPHKNFFITGKAGTGKSCIISELKKKWSEKNHKYQIVAPTGVAAFNINSVTIHSFFQLGHLETYLDELFHNQSVKNFIKNKNNLYATLVIDEISMVSKKLFLIIDLLTQSKLNSTQPFGGIQIVLVGDFFQLEPVIKDNVFYFKKQDFLNEQDEIQDGYCFGEMNENLQPTNKVWNDLNFTIFYLQESFRQQDTEFRTILDECRLGCLTEDNFEILKQRQVENLDTFIKNENNCSIIQIVGKRKTMTSINNKMFNTLSSQIEPFVGRFQWNEKCKWSQVIKTRYEETFLEDSSLSRQLNLRIGTSVMLRANLNISAGLYNGATGVVVEIDKDNNQIKFKLNSDQNVHSIGLNTFKKTIGYNDDNKFFFYQLPFCHSWAITVHKSQGLTFEKALIHLVPEEIFLCHQAYVALSRVKSLEGLYLIVNVQTSKKIFYVNDKINKFDSFLNNKNV